MTWWNRKSKPSDEPKPTNQTYFSEGSVCPNKHISPVVDQKICGTCGELTESAVIKTTRAWNSRYFASGLYTGDWVVIDETFVRYLDSPKPKPRRKK